ncbi:NAD(P)/FAD-dependent oxidoreductase [Silvanigrella aquatica]|uniref:FAD dependent oxidoreductase domain-containing protein n=1 Tax=Silvanigrella aquatica TaxID=1915309 RepID=A0A1L4D047_9BACT|nr:NAD(P)/FAD-dependent oxidoreductase [Silvanigrella aquatica]APJ03583.1 hypothetical protein AXG55_06545 [Silvanigrella aquatica]
MTQEIFHNDVIIIGAGVIGLSIAAHIAKMYPKKSVALLENHDGFGRETSSRNSEVIHAGIYYNKNSLKAKYCIKGKKLLYDFCKEYSIPHLMCGKYIVSTSEEQNAALFQLQKKAADNGVNLELLSTQQLNKEAKLSHFKNALYSPETGIFDSHKFLQTLERMAKENNVFLAYKNSFQKILEVNKDHILFEAHDEYKNSYYMKCQYFINAGGLSSAKIANQFYPNEIYKNKACRGRYYSLSSKYNHYFDKLIYPLPDKDCVGIHTTMELDGKVKLGPDSDWTFAESHEANDPSLCQFFDKEDNVKNIFFNEGKKLIPSLEFNDLTQNYIGIRPKLFINNKEEEDFHILKIENGNSQSIHLLGFESPGLTSSLAVGEDIAKSLN